MRTDQLLETVVSLEKYTVNNGTVLLAAYLHEWFRAEENGTTGRLLTLLAISLINAHHAADLQLKQHLAHHIAQLWNDTYTGANWNE